MATERSVAKSLIEAGLRRGYTVSVQDGEEWVVRRSSSASDCLKALFTTGEDRIMFRDADEERVGTFLLIGGNAPDELIADHTDNPVCNELYREVAAELRF